ncbi:nitroreductase family deazaflavin-dependent oxidoreductase [Sphaerimonospora sp. CA-214678]|uniref:nitroreductase family deazaflavin-dependent oxidoreductase n=1 Tax=Sphaerimonospora sp. CA-214678 TaxID=3240029 RepID=UPI003D8BF199
MTQNRRAGSHSGRGRGSPGPVSRWFLHRMNARASRKIRRGRDKVMGMDVLILNTVGRRSEQPRESPLAWFADGENAWLIVASGGDNRHPDWYLNLMARPERATIELPGRDPLPVTPRRLDGSDLKQAWQRIITAQPRYAKYQSKSNREYPVVRLTPR